MFVTPANAFDLELSAPSNANPEVGELVEFTAQLNIDTNERVPLENVQLYVKNQLCTFHVNGTPISGCDNIQIQLLDSANYNVGNNTFEYEDDDYDYGYGYGYEGDAKIKYKITIDTTDLNPGTYKVYLKTEIGSDKFKSDKSEFKVKESQTTIRINAGGNDYTDSNGNLWSKDYGYNTGKTSTINNPISNTVDDKLYQSERYDLPSNPELSYDISVPNGEYEVTLHFAEVWSTAFGKNKRVFDVYLENDLKLDNLDIYKEVGANKVLKKTFTVQVTDGKVDIDLKHVIQNPKISAIEIKLKEEEPEPDAIRINAGGNAFTDSNGKVWMKDTYYNTGKITTINNPISGTNDDYLFQTERFDLVNSPELSYDIPVPNGEYDVNLYFAEIWSPAFKNNKRVFDIYLENILKINNLDIYKEVGANTVLKKSYTVVVTDGKIDIDLKHEIENPKISAIEIIPSDD